MPDDRPVYGCVGSDRPDAEPYITEVDGIRYYTCPACREFIAALDAEVDPLRRGGPPAPRPHEP